MQKTNTAQKGFTIVELLIVIVIIGVLAAIAVVAFRGIQEKARTAAVLTTVESWQRYIAAQKVVGGKVKENVTSCLGKASDFPAADGFAEGECMQIYNNGNKTSSYVYRADDFSGFTNDAIPSSSHPITTYRSGNRMYKARGLVIANFATPFILYVPQLNGECGKGSRFEAENPQSSDLDGSLCGTLAI